MEVVVTQYGGPEVLQCRQTSIDPHTCIIDDEYVLVENTYAGVNFIDTYFRSGLYKKDHVPFVTGSEGAGTIIKVGKCVPEGESLIGKRVAHYAGSGSYSKYTTVHYRFIFEVPNKITDDIAAASLTQGLTAHYLIHSSYPCKEGDVVVIHAAAGGTGLLASQMAKLRGATVIGICGGPNKLQMARTVGKCDYVIDYIAQPDWPTKIREIAPQGVNAVYDGVGKSTFDGSLSVLKKCGYMISFGNASGAVPPITPLQLMAAGSVYLQRPTLNDYLQTQQEKEWRTNDVFSWIAHGKLTVTIHKIFPLAEAAKAQIQLQSRKAMGKILLKI